jgi:hypothetical protein
MVCIVVLKYVELLITVITNEMNGGLYIQIIFQNFHQFKAFVGLSDCRIIATAPKKIMFQMQTHELNTAVRPSVHASYDNISHLFPLLLIGHVVTYIVLIKGGASERCDFSQFGLSDYSYGPVLPSVRTTRYGLNSFRYNAAQIWNELPNHFRQETSLEHLKI